MTAVSEIEIRHLVRTVVAPSPLPKHSMFVDEFVIGDTGRIDLALIGERLAGFELKSDFDNLARLPRQMEAYGKVFDYCTLVITKRHLAKAREILLPGWGLVVVSRGVGTVLEYREIRRPRVVKTVRKDALAGLLWRDELVHALDLFNAADGFRSKPREVLVQRLSAITEIDQLRSLVTSVLTARQGWRDVQGQHENGAIVQRASVSSGFLARRLRSQHR